MKWGAASGVTPCSYECRRASDGAMWSSSLRYHLAATDASTTQAPVRLTAPLQLVPPLADQFGCAHAQRLHPCSDRQHSFDDLGSPGDVLRRRWPAVGKPDAGGRGRLEEALQIVFAHSKVGPDAPRPSRPR